jgi:hypothetical protein
MGDPEDEEEDEEEKKQEEDEEEENEGEEPEVPWQVRRGKAKGESRKAEGCASRGGAGIGGTWSRAPLAGCDRGADQRRVV